MKKKYYILFVLISCILIFLLFLKKNKSFTNLNESTKQVNDIDHNTILLKKKGIFYVNNNFFDSLKYIVNKINVSDSSEEVVIFNLYNYLNEKDTIEFQSLLKKCQNINSDNLFYLVNLGSILLNADYYNESLSFYQKADSLYGNRNTNVILNIAIIYTRLDENKKAIDILSKALKFSNMSDLYYIRAVAFYNVKQFYNAVLDLNMAIEIAKTNPDYYFLRGKILKETGNILAGNIDIDLAYKYGYSK